MKVLLLAVMPGTALPACSRALLQPFVRRRMRTVSVGTTMWSDNVAHNEDKAMYKHILLPTDGSELSKLAVESGVLLARNIDATVVGVYVLPVPHKDLLDTWAHHDPDYARKRLALFDRMADEALSFVANSALALEVPCTCRKVESDEPHAAIIAVADESRCDLIYMASHGWKEPAPYLGTVTLRVLHDSKIPVLVYKPGNR